ncbi:serine/threonine-protein kinase/endoribonuclease IRE1-like [Bidens hawaiensis]|uniref:serine/threonine-protein kinase/endoribonuclease IRE1-like n=1 Tax=Bidens hawaiensis TaxID=980011 RepID=UPI004049F040
MKAPAVVASEAAGNYVTPHEQTLMKETIIWPSFQVFRDKEIGRGSNGTVVYLGEYPRGGPVAVKCLSEDQYNAKREGYKILRRCATGYAHIVRLFAFEKVGNYICAMVSLCDYDLNHLVRNEWLYADLLEEKGYPEPHLLELMTNIADGLKHLHARRVIYGDLNPSHVLIEKFDTDIAKLSMVGSCRRLAEDETSLRSDATGN